MSPLHAAEKEHQRAIRRVVQAAGYLRDAWKRDGEVTEDRMRDFCERVDSKDEAAERIAQEIEG